MPVKMISKPTRPALLPLDHPLCYSTAKPKPLSLHDGAWTGVEARPENMQSMMQRLLDRQDIVNLLNDYAYVLDTVMVNPEVVTKWADLFTADCSVTYPFGEFIGRGSLPEMCLEAETRFERMIHMSSNFSIVFESDTVAYGRSALFAVCGTDPTDIGKNFAEGGYYYWTFRKEAEGGQRQWRISFLYLDVTWSQGDSLGLNEPLHLPAVQEKEFVHTKIDEISNAAVVES